MKVLALVFFLASASALGSGPYLPSGWKPSGPAFYLPTEVEQPAVILPLKDVPVQDSSSGLLAEFQVEEEPSGSDALREYGPPKLEVTEVIQEVSEVSQDISQQALPEPITEQAFVVIEAKFNKDEATSADVQEVVSEKIIEEISTATESEVAEQTTEAVIQGKSLDIESQTESSLVVEENAVVAENNGEVVVEVSATEKAVEEAQVTQEENIVAVVDKKIEEEVSEVKAVEDGVKNIAEALVNLENEIKAQVEAVQEVEIKSVLETSGAVQQSPAGFLEYGPPGFTEYGPPKGDLRTIPSLESNEVRRRRFSPKFRSTKRKH